MPRKSHGARIVPYRHKGRPTVLIIRDGKTSRSTGFGDGDRPKADAELAKYIAGKDAEPDTQQRDLAKIAVLEVMKLYQTSTPVTKPSYALIGFHALKLGDFWGDKHLSDVKRSTCASYTAWRVKNGAKESTARRELKTLSAAINYWHGESPLAAVPKVTLPEEGARRERILERSEVAAMLRACRKRKWNYVARFIIIGIYTGTRHAAVLGLRWDAALSGGHVDLERGILYRRGSAEKETSKRRPPYNVPKRMAAFFEKWARADRRNGFTHIIHCQGQRIAKLRKSFRTICNDAGLGPEVIPHTLRHTCATWNLWAGKSIWDVAEIIGADASTVERVYGHHRINAAISAAKRRVV